MPYNPLDYAPIREYQKQRFYIKGYAKWLFNYKEISASGIRYIFKVKTLVTIAVSIVLVQNQNLEEYLSDRLNDTANTLAILLGIIILYIISSISKHHYMTRLMINHINLDKSLTTGDYESRQKMFQAGIYLEQNEIRYKTITDITITFILLTILFLKIPFLEITVTCLLILYAYGKTIEHSELCMIESLFAKFEQNNEFWGKLEKRKQYDTNKNRKPKKPKTPIPLSKNPKSKSTKSN